MGEVSESVVVGLVVGAAWLFVCGVAVSACVCMISMSCWTCGS